MKLEKFTLLAIAIFVTSNCCAGRLSDLVRECEQGYGSSCTLAGLSYRFGNYGAKKSWTLAKKYYEKACNLGNGMGCGCLAEMYEKGNGVKRSYVTAADYYAMACKMGVGAACNNLGFLYDKGRGVRQSYSTAKELYGLACDLRDELGCDNYSKMNRLGY